jgi:predicted dinucleotide-binding enzyme
MSYAIVGVGKIGQALAHARKNIDVTVASRRPPEALAPQARAIGPTVAAKSLQDALDADTIILAVPFGEHREVAKALPTWKGKTVIDAMNALVPPEELDGLPSSAFVATAFTGAKFRSPLFQWLARTKHSLCCDLFRLRRRSGRKCPSVSGGKIPFPKRRWS